MKDLLGAIIALFIIVDPFGNIPIFVGSTETMEEKQRNRTFNIAMLVSVILLLVFAFAGLRFLKSLICQFIVFSGGYLADYCN